MKGKMLMGHGAARIRVENKGKKMAGGGGEKKGREALRCEKKNVYVLGKREKSYIDTKNIYRVREE